MSDSDTTDKLTPFSGKAKEIARNLSLISDRFINCSQLISQINAHMTDLIILADELDLEEGEIEKIADIVQEGMQTTDGILSEIAQLDKKSRDTIIKMFGPEGLGNYMDRKVVNPYDPIFTYKDSSSRRLASKVASKFMGHEVDTFSKESFKKDLIRLGNTKPSLRKYIKPLLFKITADLE